MTNACGVIRLFGRLCSSVNSAGVVGVVCAMTELHNRPNNRMTPHAFVIRGELGYRADEAMRWWYFDTDLDFRARLAGGVLSVEGPRVVNSRANTTTVGLLAGQAQGDHGVFDAKWVRQ